MFAIIEGVVLGSQEKQGKKGSFWITQLEQRSSEGYPVVASFASYQNGRKKGDKISARVRIRPQAGKGGGVFLQAWEESPAKKG